ncbi:MAG: OB-fold nucleic acid binding domain-containing protein [Candidatus Tritonobacter lacicola]|nr:OB-fold nucleic acid binding domain-containing protein [Candidatus Tritonobacter lacicola]
MEEKNHTDKSGALKGEFDSVRDFPEETLCPSCGKFVGAYEKCPYCGATLKKRMALAIFKRGCLVMSVVGLIALWYAAVMMEPELITIGEIGPTYNKGIFRVKGIVDKVKINPDAFFKVQFHVDDGTGKIKLQTGDLEKLELMNKVPNIGDEVEAIGEVSLSAQFGTSMNLKAPGRMKMIRKEVQTVKIGDIDDEDVGQMYALHGEVVSVSEYPYGTLVMLGDETGFHEITISSYQMEQLPDAEAVMTPGTELDIVVLVGSYRDALQIKPRTPQDVQVSGEDTIETSKIPKKMVKKGYAKADIGSLKASDKGKKVQVKGKISGVKKFNKMTKITLTDGTGSVDVTLWDSQFADYPNKASVLREGSEVIVFGKVDEYQGTVQLKPGDKSDLEPVKKDAPPKKKEEKKPEAPKPEPTKPPAPKPAPTKAPTKPEPTKPPAPKPAATKAETKPEPTKPPAAKPTPAQTEAKVEPTKAAEPPEKKPEATKPPATKPEATETEAPTKKKEPKAEAPKKPSITFTPLKIGEITMEKDGTFVEIKGEVAGSREFSKGLKLEVKDDSGTIDVVLWTNLLEKLTDTDKLTKDGAKLSVKGKVGSFREEMQLTPKYPNQIKLSD